VERKNKRAQGVPFEDYYSLYGRIDRMESSLHGIVAKVKFQLNFKKILFNKN
jgi:hypothetical protein